MVNATAAVRLAGGREEARGGLNGWTRGHLRAARTDV